MSSGTGLLLAFVIGFVAGLRSMTAPAIVAWAAHLGWINLAGSPLAFMGATWVVVLFTIAALGEYVADQLPSTPARTTAGPLAARVVMGLLTGASIAVGAGAALWIGALLGAIGSIVGAFGGYEARTRLVRGLHVPDAVIAIPEDLIAIGLGLLAVKRF